MKKVGRLALMVMMAGGLAACQYDDTALWNEMNQVKQELEDLKEQVRQTNTNLAALGQLVDALAQNLCITEVVTTEEGYVLYFTDGSSIALYHGEDGANGTNAPVISLRQDTDGLYYWTLDGEWLLVDGEKVCASGQAGQDGITPQIRINETTKEWEISLDGGTTWVSTGVVAQGSDSQTGSAGIQVDNTHPDYVIIVLEDGTQLCLSRYDASAPVFLIEGVDGVQSFDYQQERSYSVVAENIWEYSIAKPDGWRVSYADGTLVVTAPDAENTYAEQEGTIAFHLVSESNKCVIVKMDVVVSSGPGFVLRTLTFEDEDALFAPYWLDYAGVEITTWSDLIDDPEYGGPLAYGDFMSCAYTWYDENNTFLMHTFPYNYGAYCYWGGGHVVSDYASTDYVTYGTYENQQTVYGPTGAGGHNGSPHFGMHFGYKDSSPYNGTENLPSWTFGDGQPRVIDHLYVNNSAYAINCYMNGNGLTAVIGESDWVKVVATGYDADGQQTGTEEFFLCNGPDHIITEWTKWDLSGLGEVLTVEFNILGSSDNGYGFSQPAYFAFDDVAVRF